ncbi:MAG: hypothetical protein ACI906_001848 [Candidatus Latescibacterota bacterium]|jgi:hypothetical protein
MPNTPSSLIYLLLLAGCIALAAHADEITFTDQTIAAGIDFVHVGGGKDKGFILEGHGSGAAFFDGDGDGDLDLYFVNGSTFADYGQGTGPSNRYYRNEGGRFVDGTQGSGLQDRDWGAGVAIADYDGDGHRDVYVTNYGANSLYRNKGDGSFVRAADAAGAQGDDFSASAAFFDYDNDGDLDLYVSNYVAFDIAPLLEDPQMQDPCIYLGGLRVFCGPVGLPGGHDRLYRNDSGLVFIDVTEASGIAAANDYYGLGVVPEDFDLDGDLDLFVANDETANVLWQNDGAGLFHDVGVLAGVAFNLDGEEESGMGVDVGDYDLDGDGDIFVTNFYGETNTLYRNDGGLNFVDATANSGLAAPSVEYLGWGARFFDADNDGDLDLFTANGHVYPQVDAAGAGGGYAQRNQVFRNDGGLYEEVDGGPGLAVEAVSRGSASGDYDSDGDLDLLVTNVDAAPTLLRNDGGNERNWLWVELEGQAANLHGVGARVTVRADGSEQVRTVNSASGYLGANELLLHFGLGDNKSAEWVQVQFLGGARDTIFAAQAKTKLFLRERTHGKN